MQVQVTRLPGKPSRPERAKVFEHERDLAAMLMNMTMLYHEEEEDDNLSDDARVTLTQEWSEY